MFPLETWIKAMPHTVDPSHCAGTVQGPDEGPSRGAPTQLPSIDIYSHGHTNVWHHHNEACLIYPSEGVVTVETDEGHWVVPPQRAVWVPAGVRHQSRTSGHVAISSLIVNQASVPGLPEEACILGITPLLRELIIHACTNTKRTKGPDGRAIAIILDQIRSLPLPALPLPIPQDRRLRRLVDALLENPADNRSLADWGRTVGASSRTLARLFRAETSMTFRTWRQHLRILEALRRLSQGESVINVAVDVGYDSPSAFVQVFKRTLGQTPGRYFS
jgi:AraC-like DNA-binding protein/mannose-6-phosphate isomerase-like protein (cupin superfamily)